MILEEHEEISLIMFGNRYTEVHSFLDQYFPMFGPYHRIVRHHQLGVDLVVRKYSEFARAAAGQHIIDDLGKVPQDWRDFEEYTLEYAEAWSSRKVHLPADSIRKVMSGLYLDHISLFK